jgi:hypothetical protein
MEVGGEVYASSTSLLKRDPRYPLHRMLLGMQSQCGCLGEQTNVVMN